MAVNPLLKVSTTLKSNYFITDGQSASLSWYRTTIWDAREIALPLYGKYFPIFAIY
jgi:hypothetical protein